MDISTRPSAADTAITPTQRRQKPRSTAAAPSNTCIRTSKSLPRSAQDEILNPKSITVKNRRILGKTEGTALSFQTDRHSSDVGGLGLSQISGVDGSSGMAANFALRFGGTS